MLPLRSVALGSLKHAETMAFASVIGFISSFGEVNVGSDFHINMRNHL
jgi:hypothetical protein